MVQILKSLSSSVAGRLAPASPRIIVSKSSQLRQDLTVAEIAAAEEDNAALPKHQLERIEYALG